MKLVFPNQHQLFWNYHHLWSCFSPQVLKFWKYLQSKILVLTIHLLFHPQQEIQAYFQPWKSLWKSLEILMSHCPSRRHYHIALWTGSGESPTIWFCLLGNLLNIGWKGVWQPVDQLQTVDHQIDRYVPFYKLPLPSLSWPFDHLKKHYLIYCRLPCYQQDAIIPDKTTPFSPTRVSS